MALNWKLMVALCSSIPTSGGIFSYYTFSGLFTGCRHKLVVITPELYSVELHSINNSYNTLYSKAFGSWYVNHYNLPLYETRDHVICAVTICAN